VEKVELKGKKGSEKGRKMEEDSKRSKKEEKSGWGRSNDK
jgi:hypothetical protein